MMFRHFAGLVLLASGTVAQQPVPPDSIARLIDLDGLPILTPGVTCRQFASTDPSGKGEDHGHFLRKDGDRCVLADMRGPGVITRLWSANAMGRLRVFVDGEDTPRIDAPFQDLFTGKLSPFVAPIATHVSGGWISYFPIPYAVSCRVEVDQLDNPSALYYQVQYLSYPAGTAMRSFTTELPAGERAALQRVLDCWRRPGDAPIERLEGDAEPTATETIGAGESMQLFTSERPGTILTLRLEADPCTPATLRGLLLQCEFDGAAAVQVPVGDFFGCGFGPTPYRGLLQGWDESGGYCNLPMPFHRSARISVRNTSDVEVSVTGSLRVRQTAPPADAGVLHAEFRAIDGVGDELYEFARIEGPGKYIGITQALQGVGDLWYLEGNEQFFVDGERLPSILGTGTEDFYNGGWYWDGGTFAQPLHGLGVKQEWTTNRTTPWRMQLPDAVPFVKGLVARIEHGSRNAVRDGYYSSVAYWYAPPSPVRRVRDEQLTVPRLWVTRPRQFVGATELQWQPAPELRTWEQLTDTRRGLDRPLFQAFPVSYVEKDGAPVDARVALFAAGDSGRDYRATFQVPFADRYRLQLRMLAPAGLPGIELDGRQVRPSEANQDSLPMRMLDVDAGALTAGDHQLQFSVPAGSTMQMAFDCMRLSSQSPFVRTWWVAPRVAARPDGTVEDAMPEEAAFLAPDFDPKAAGWKLVQARGDGLDLNREVSPEGQTLAYLLVFAHTDTAHEAHLLLGSDDGARVWVNGELRHSHAIHRPLTADQDQFDAPLRAGWNRILLKVKNDDGGYGVMLRICDADGTLRLGSEAK